VIPKVEERSASPPKSDDDDDDDLAALRAAALLSKRKKSQESVQDSRRVSLAPWSRSYQAFSKGSSDKYLDLEFDDCLVIKM
jgi:hypothetical protein